MPDQKKKAAAASSARNGRAADGRKHATLQDLADGFSRIQAAMEKNAAATAEASRAAAEASRAAAEANRAAAEANRAAAEANRAVKELSVEVKALGREVKELGVEVKALSRTVDALGRTVDGLSRTVDRIDCLVEDLGVRVGYLADTTSHRIDRVVEETEGLKSGRGKIAEGMFLEGLPRAMEEVGIPLHDVRVRLRKSKHGREYDLVGINTRVIAVVEVKANFRLRDVDDLDDALEAFCNDFPELTGGRDVVGVIAGMTVDPRAMEAARKSGYYVLVQDAARHTRAFPPESVKPRTF